LYLDKKYFAFRSAYAGAADLHGVVGVAALQV